MRITWRWLAGVALLAAIVTQAQTRPVHKRALADHFGPFLPKHLNDCQTCHLPDRADGKKDPDDEKPHNPFGHRLDTVRKELKQAGKESKAIAARVAAIADDDSDQDGVPNLIELLTGHNPGDANDKPDAKTVAEAKKKQAAFATRKIYPWAPFEKAERPAVPKVKNAAWVRTPIDAFVAEQHELFGLKPRPEAARHLLIRRVHLDLIGLPPTPAEVAAFVNDTNADAYEKLVDKLLASPRYGERWARHWMDVWRYVDYGESGLQDGWEGAPNMWRWRDWIISSLNDDKGYDRMVQEMLAADELCPTDLSALPATLYLARNKSRNRDTWLHDTVDHTARAFLGLTMECARCHNHMYDRIPQVEYYQLRAVFEGHSVRTDLSPDGAARKEREGGLTRVYDANVAPKTFLYVRGDEQRPDKSKPLEPGVPTLLSSGEYKVVPVELPLAGYAPHRHPHHIERVKKQAEQELTAARAALKEAEALAAPEQALARLAVELALARKKAIETVLEVETLEDQGLEQKKDRSWEQAALNADTAQRVARLLEAKHKKQAAQLELAKADGKLKEAARRALTEAERNLAKVEAEASKPATTRYQKRGSMHGSKSSGRRLALARWITARDNPLAARVAVNHIWLRHFGTALVPSVFEFGANGLPPTHPALVDWLAVEFMENGWSMKKLHRQILLSSTYRLGSTPDAANEAVDPDNQFLWKMPSRRMEAEIVRDSILNLTGKLDLTMHGPEVDTKLSNSVLRRSIYFRYTDSDFVRFMEAFDLPPTEDCYRRSESIVPQQALTLLNSELAVEQARLLGRALSKAAKDDADFVKQAFERVLARPVTPAELAACAAYLVEQKKYAEANQSKLGKSATGPDDYSRASADPQVRARESLVHMLLNHNDFVTIR